jgi:hypothetical protein
VIIPWNELQFGCTYTIHTSPDCTCDNCGTQIGHICMTAIYKGMLDGAHWFDVCPWSCLECHIIHTTHRVINNNITQEIKNDQI